MAESNDAFNPLLVNLVPHHAQRRQFKPVEGAFITLMLPGEMIRAKVCRVVSEDSVVAQIDSPPMGRGHAYHKGDVLPCRRVVDDFLKTEQWEVVSEHELNLAEAAWRFERDEKERMRIVEEQKAIAAPAEEPMAVPPSLVQEPDVAKPPVRRRATTKR